MKIKKITFNQLQTSDVGLKEINIDRLGSVVALIGKNGSGKSRILNFLENKFLEILTLNDFLKGNIIEPPNEILNSLKQLEPYKTIILKQELLSTKIALSQKEPKNTNLISEIKLIQEEISKIEQSFLPNKLVNKPQINNPLNTGIPVMRTTQLHLLQQQQQQKVQHQQQLQQQALQQQQLQKDTLIKGFNTQISKIQKNYIKRVDYSQIRQLQDAISEKEDDINSFEKLIESVTEQLDYNEFGSLYKSSLRFLKKLPHQLVDDWMECMGDTTKFEKRIAFIRYKALKDIFEKFFGKTLEWEQKKIKKKVTDNGVESTTVGFWKINNREFNYKEFSEGEKTLFAYVLLFFLMSQNNSIRLKESIIIIDEPELHLHPDAEIDLINGLREIIKEKGQLWIATHSINILSHLNFDEVFMVRDGEIKFPSCTIQREALFELLKIEDRVQKLSEFLTAISDWTFVQFMIECFTNPDVIEIAKENDPQITSLKELIDLSSSNTKSLLLDFGAGKGRLYEQAMLDEKFKTNVEYSALEPNNDFHLFLTSRGVKKIYSTYNELADNSFDFIVLCNVLHEINIDEWVPTLNKIINAIKTSGNLIIIEAKMLTKGEQVGSIGYLLLDEYEIKELFNLKQLPIKLRSKESLENITGVLIPKAELNSLSNENLLNAMKALERNTFAKIEKLRQNTDNSSANTKLGRQSAFLSQLHINSKIAQKHLTGQKKQS